MGNSEGGHSRTPGRTSSGGTESSRLQSKPHKAKSPTSHLASPASQLLSPHQTISPDPNGRTVFYDGYSDTDKYHTCKSGFETDSHSKDIPTYYFTASQLARAKKLSKSHDADLNRTSSVTQKPDVRHVAWSPGNRKSVGDIVSMMYFINLMTACLSWQLFIVMYLLERHCTLWSS